MAADSNRSTTSSAFSPPLVEETQYHIPLTTTFLTQDPLPRPKPGEIFAARPPYNTPLGSIYDWQYDRWARNYRLCIWGEVGVMSGATPSKLASSVGTETAVLVLKRAYPKR